MEVLKAPDLRLRVKTKEVRKITPALLQTTREMIRLTQTFKDPEGVGLASTQVGLTESFFVALEHPPKKGERTQFITVFNPRIIKGSKKMITRFEGCLSVPNMWGEVKRHISVKVSYQDITGKEVQKTLSGLLGHIFQHEVDHLNGVLFSDKVLSQKGKFYKFIGRDPQTGEDHFEEVTL